MGNKKIRLGLVGVGNCAASLVEGIVFYKDQETADRVGGLMHYNVGGYEPSDIQVVVGLMLIPRRSARMSARLFGKNQTAPIKSVTFHSSMRLF